MEAEASSGEVMDDPSQTIKTEKCNNREDRRPRDLLSENLK
jgi:hypothetical protein